MLKILVISTWFGVWLVNCIRFSWIIVGFFILTKLLAYTFFLEDISTSFILGCTNILISNNFYRQTSCLLREICVHYRRLLEISAELRCMHYLSLSLVLLSFRIHLLLLLLVLLMFVIITIIVYNSILRPTKRKE